MRKFLSFTLIGFLVFLLSGCFSSDSVDPSTEGLESLVVRGTLQSLGSVHFSAKATHLLRREEGGILYVYSGLYDLDDPLYLNQPVEATGFLFPPDDTSTRETLLIESLTVLDASELISDEVVRRTYTHPSLGFSWMVRSDWTINESPTEVVFTAPEEPVVALPTEELSVLEELSGAEAVVAEPVGLDTISVRRMANIQELPIEEWYLAYVLTPGAVSPYTKSAIGPESIPAIRADVKDSKGNKVTYFISDGPQVFLVSHHSPQANFRLEYANLFADMLFSFDPLRDGARAEAPSPTTDSSPAVTEPEVGVEAPHAALLASLQQVSLSSLIPQSGSWTALRYDFVEPNYVYIVYGDAAGTQSRVLVRQKAGSGFERVAAFDKGESTDWTLTSGVDEAKGKTITSLRVSSGSVTTIPEGYRSMESASLHFQMSYPTRWYYSRGGNFFYFSDVPADESNALATLEIVSSPVAAYKESASSPFMTIVVPRDESSSFKLRAPPENFEILQTMAKSLTLTDR